METPISGRCDPAFSAVQAAFEGNFAERGEVGAGVSIVVDGTLVVDLIGGWADEARTKPWQPDTIVDFYSVGRSVRIRGRSVTSALAGLSASAIETPASASAT